MFKTFCVSTGPPNFFVFMCVCVCACRYGKDHDATLMSAIADTNGGAFTYVEATAAVASAFAACLGRALASSLGGVTVVLTAVGGARVTEVTTGYTYTIDDARRRVVVDIGVLQEGEERDVLVDVALPAGSDGAAVEAVHACAYIGGVPVGPSVVAQAAAVAAAGSDPGPAAAASTAAAVAGGAAAAAPALGVAAVGAPKVDPATPAAAAAAGSAAAVAVSASSGLGTPAAATAPGPVGVVAVAAAVAAVAAIAPVDLDAPRSDGLSRSIVLARADKPPVLVPDEAVESSVVRVTGAKVLKEAATASAAGDVRRTQTLLKAYIDDSTARGFTADGSPALADAIEVHRLAVHGDARGAAMYATEGWRSHAQQKSVAVSGARCVPCLATFTSIAAGRLAYEAPSTSCRSFDAYASAKSKELRAKEVCAILFEAASFAAED